MYIYTCNKVSNSMDYSDYNRQHLCVTMAAVTRLATLSCKPDKYAKVMTMPSYYIWASTWRDT